MATNTTQPNSEAVREQVRADTPRALAKSPRNIEELLAGPEFKAAVDAVLPKCVRADRFVRVALNAVMRQPALLECTKESFFRAMLELSAFGLEPDGRRAHLIPFRNNKMCVCGHFKDNHNPQSRVCAGRDCKCARFTARMDVQLIVDYKGLVELVRRSGDVAYIHADVVYENDDWDYGFGSGAFLRHKPNLDNRGERRIAYYSFVKLKDGSEDFMVLSPREVEDIRARSKSPDAGPWVSDYDEMGKKSAFRRHSKWLPLSSDLREAVEADDEAIDVTGISFSESIGAAAEQRQIGPATGSERLKEKLKDIPPTQAAPAASQAPAAAPPADEAPPTNTTTDPTDDPFLHNPQPAEAPPAAARRSRGGGRTDKKPDIKRFATWEAWEQAGSPVHDYVVIESGEGAGSFRNDDEAGNYKRISAQEVPGA